MPMYEFHCESCDASFDERVSVDQRDHAVTCPHCGSRKTARKLSVVAVGAPAGKPGASAGHVHSGMCGCGKPHGSCGLN